MKAGAYTDLAARLAGPVSAGVGWYTREDIRDTWTTTSGGRDFGPTASEPTGFPAERPR